MRQNYLVIPLNFGPQLGFLLNRVSIRETTGTRNRLSLFPEDGTFRYSGDFELDYGAALGLSYKINEDIQIRLRYYRGFKNIIADSFSSNFQEQKGFNSVFQLSASYAIF